VLIVDDNLDAASSLAMLVEILGHEVRLAADGIEAVEVASEFRPELVLLDIGLPGLSGYDVARRIRDQEWGRGAVLAAVTGWGQEADRHLALAAGCDLHATKPLTLKTLRAILETVAQPAPAERGPR
jgi:CheY-like chemotaxis protein